MNDNNLLNINLLNNVQPLTPVHGLNNVKGLQDVAPLTFYNSTTYNPKKALNIVNDDRSKANSILDVLFSGTERNDLLDGTIFEWTKNIPLVSQAAGILTHAYDAFIDPVVQNGPFSGQAWKEVGLNTLNEVGEDLDILSNIVKSQMPSAGGGVGLDNLADSLGLNGTRKSFNYNTGSTLGDIALEVISDPLTMLELGASAVGAAGKSGTKSVVSATTKEVSSELSEQALKDWSKAVTKTVAKEGKDATVESVLKNISRRSKDVVEASLKDKAPDIIETAVKSKGYKMYSAASKLKASADAVDNVLTKAAWYATPVGLPAHYAKPIIKNAISSLYSNLVSKLNTYDLTRNFVKHQGTYKEAIQDTIFKNNAIHETIFKNNARFFRTLGIDSTELQMQFYRMIKQMNNFNENDDLVKEFIDYLSKNNDKFKLLLTKEDFLDYIHSNAFDELINATSVGPIAIHRAEQTFSNSYHNATLDSMRKYINTHKDNLTDTFEYIDKTVLNYNGKQFGLEDLDGFLNELLINKTTSKEYTHQIATLLESLGINRNNATRINEILNSKIKNKSLAIRKLLDNTNTGSKLLTDNDYIKMLNKTNNRINDITNSELNKVWKEDIATHNVDKYQEVINGSIKNIEDAVNRIINDQDVSRAVAYIQNVIRLQDIPDWKNTMDLIEVAIKENPKLLDTSITGIVRNQIDEIDSFLKDTTNIINRLNKTTAVANDIPAWFNKLESTQSTLKQVYAAFANFGGPYAEKALKSLRNLQEALDTFMNPNILDNIVNYVDEVNGLMQAQASHLGMFNILTQHTHLTSNVQLKSFLEQLSLPDSVLRTRTIPDIVNKLNDAGLYAQANNINKVMAQVDTVRNLSTLLNTEINTTFKLSNRTQEDLLTMLFDIIENNKNVTVTDLASKPYTSGSAYIKSGLDYNTYINETKTIYETIIGTIDERIDKTNKVLERIAKDTQGLNPDDVLTEIKTQLHNIFDDYVKAQSKIKYVDNITLSSLYSTDTINALQLTNNIRLALARGTEVSVEVLNEFDVLSREFNNFAEAIQGGIDNIQKIKNEMQVPFSYTEATTKLKQLQESYNLFSGSVESGMYTAKYIVSRDFEDLFNLKATDIVGSNQEYVMLADRLNMYKDILHEEYKYTDTKYIERLRETLTQVYSQPNALFAPKHPGLYFKELGIQQLLSWECLTKGNLSIKNKTNFYSIAKNLLQEQDIERYTMSDMVSRIEAVTRDNGFTHGNALAEAICTAESSNALEYANRIVDADLMKTLHSLDDLGTHKDDVVKFLKDNVQDQDYITKAIIDIENDPALRTSYDTFGNADDMHKLIGTSYGYEDALFDGQHTMYAERKTAQALSIAEMSAEELATHIYRQTPGGLVFYNQNIIRILNPDGSVTWSGLDNLFNFTKEELEQAGLKMQQDGDWFYVRLTDNRVHEASLKYKELNTNYRTVQDKFTNLVDRYRNYLNMYEMEDIPANIITVESLNENTWNRFLDEHADFFGDIEERKLYQKLTKQGHSNFFDKSFSRLNVTVVGGFDAYNIWNTLYSDDFIPRSTQMSRNTLAGLTNAVNRSNKINKYLTMFFNNDYSLDNPLFKTMFSEASDQRITQFFAEGKYNAVILRQDKMGLPKVFEYNITNRKTLNKAIDAGAILVPKETYSAMKQVVNDRKMTNSLLDIYKRVVPSTYKSMYLFTAGFPFRNAFDTLVFKNANELGGITELPRVFKYEREASKAIEFHNKIQQEVLDFTGGETFNKEALLQVLNKYTKEDAELYYLIDLFMESGASGGLSDSLSNWLEEYNKLHTEDVRQLWEKFYEDKVLFGKQKLNPLARLREFNDHIEKTGRLGLFLASVDEGLPINEAIDRVIKTHFDYNSSSDLMDICERIFWFSTFPINNFNYYVNGGLTKSPTMTKLLMDAQTASWNNGEYTYEELKKTNFLAYHALTGNIRIGNWIVKLSPSLFDFINLVTDVPGNIKDRLNPFLAIATGTTDNIADELNPAISQIRNWQKFKEGNPVPSILSKINDYDWTRLSYKWRGNNQKTWTTYPRIKKPTATVRYLRKYYSRRYRTNVRKFSRTSLYHDTVNYYRIYKKGSTYRDL